MIPASIRNNNPGAMEPGFASRRFGSTSYETLRWQKGGTVKENRCATFPTSIHGAAAMFVLLSEGKAYRNKPLQEAIATWCGRYWAETYVKRLHEATGILPSTVLTNERMRDPAFAVPLVMAMANHEGGKPYPMTEAEWHEAHAMAFGGRAAPEPTPDNDVPFQRPEARRREVVSTVLKVGGAVAGTVGTATTAVVQNGIPDVPTQVTKSIEHAGNWTSAAKKMPTVGGEIWANMIPVLMIAVIVAGGIAIMRRNA